MAQQQDFRVKRGLVVGEAATVTGNLSVGGVLTITGNTSLASNTTFNGAVSIANTLNVTGAVTTTNSASVGGTLLVTRAATLSNTIAVTGAATFSNTLSVTGQANVGGALGVAGGAFITGPATVNGAVTIANSLAVSATATVSGALSVGGQANVGGALNVTGATSLANTLGVTGVATFGNNVTISGNLVVSGSTTYVNTAVLNIADNIVTLNADWPIGTAPSENAGIEVNRGSFSTVGIRWNETSDVWEAASGAGIYSQLHYGGTGAANVSSDNSNGTVLQDIALTIDTFGHVTGASVGTANLDVRYLSFRNIAFTSGQTTIVADAYDDTLTVANGTAIDITSDPATDKITFAHSDTSSATSIAIDNIDGTVIQDLNVTVDSMGHVTAVSAASANLDVRYDARYAGFQTIRTFTKTNVLTGNVVASSTSINVGNTSGVTNGQGIVNLAFPAGTTVNVANATHLTASTPALSTYNGTTITVGNFQANIVADAYDDSLFFGVSPTITVTANAATEMITLDVASANTSQAGVVQLSDSVSNTSVTLAATANAVKTAYSLAVTANTAAGNAYANAVSYANSAAGTAYSNAVAYVDTYKAPKASPVFSGVIDVSSANVAIGTNLYVTNISNAVKFTFTNSGEFTAAGSVTAYSDERLKSDVKQIENALLKTLSLRGVTYTKDGQEGIGVIAQETEQVLPQVVFDNPDGFKSVAYGNIVGVLIEAIRELNQKVEELQAQLDNKAK